MMIYCCGCGEDVDARLTDGVEIYQCADDHRPFWICDCCGSYVGTHHKTGNPNRPLGVLAPANLRVMRRHIHTTLDPLHQSGTLSRNKVYRKMAEALGQSGFHTAQLRTFEDHSKALSAAMTLAAQHQSIREDIKL